jgi:hypothetical protein
MSPDEPEIDVDDLLRRYLRQDRELRTKLVREWKEEIAAEGQRRLESIGRVGAISRLRDVIDGELTRVMREARRRGVSLREIEAITGLSKDHVRRRTHED